MDDCSLWLIIWIWSLIKCQQLGQCELMNSFSIYLSSNTLLDTFSSACTDFCYKSYPAWSWSWIVGVGCCEWSVTPIAHLDCRLLSREDSRPGQFSLRDHWLAKYLISRRSDQNRTKLTADCVANTAGCNGRVLEVAELLQVWPKVAAGLTRSCCRFDTLDRSDRRELPFFLRLLQFLFFLALHSNGRRFCRLLSEQFLDTLDFTQSRF